MRREGKEMGTAVSHTSRAHQELTTLSASLEWGRGMAHLGLRYTMERSPFSMR